MMASAEGSASVNKASQTPHKACSKAQVDVSNLTDFEISLLVLERDVSQYRVERIDELLNKIGEAKGFADAEKKLTATFVPEETFTILKFEPAKGERLGEFEVAYKNNNPPRQVESRLQHSTPKQRCHKFPLLWT